MHFRGVEQASAPIYANGAQNTYFRKIIENINLNFFLINTPKNRLICLNQFYQYFLKDEFFYTQIVFFRYRLQMDVSMSVAKFFLYLKQGIFLPSRLVFKVANSCCYHCDAIFVGYIDGILIAFRASWMDNRCYSCFCCFFYCVRHWEECIRC